MGEINQNQILLREHHIKMTTFDDFQTFMSNQIYKKLLCTYRRSLSQFNLLGRYEPEEVMSEALIRCMDAKTKGKMIYNLEAWLRSTGFKIVQEFSRDSGRAVLLEQTILESLVSDPSDGLLVLQVKEEIHILYNVLKELDDGDIIQMKYIENLSWQEVANRLVERTGETVSVDALRQRAARAKKVLVKKFSERFGL